jgi:hypothetical protein
MTGSREIAERISPDWWIALANRRWVAIARVNDAVDVGLTDEGDWLVHLRRPDGSEELHSPSSAAGVAMLPLLERPPERFIAALSTRASELRIETSEIADAFPLREVIDAALRTRSDYWIELAARWLDAEIISPGSVAVAIGEAADDLKISQHLRHRLRRLARTGG